MENNFCNNTNISLKIIKTCLILALIFVYSYNFTFANIDSLEKVLTKVSDNNKPEIYNQLAKLYQSSSYEKSEENANLALIYSKKYYDKINESQAYFNKGFNCVTKNNASKALEYFLKSLDIRLEIGDKNLIAGSLNALGNVTRLMGNNHKALEYYYKALEIRNELRDTIMIGATINNIGIVFKSWGNYEKALEFYMQSLSYSEKLKDTATITPALINIGNLLFDLKRYERALQYYMRVYDIAVKHNNLMDLSKVYNLIGTSLNYMNREKEAIEYFNKSYDLGKEIGNLYTQCDALNNLGESYQKLNQTEIALDYYYKSAEISSSSDDIYSYAATLNNIGSLYLSKQNYKKALEVLLESKEFSTKLNNLNLIKENSYNIAKAYEGLGEYRKAIQFHNLFAITRDSLLSESMNKKILELQVKFETEKKEKEIELLRNERKAEAEKSRYLFALLSLGLLLLIVILVLFALKIKANRQLEEKNQLILSQKDTLSKTLEDLNTTNKANEEYLHIIQEEMKRASDYVISLLPPRLDTPIFRARWLLKPSDNLGGDTFGYHQIDEENYAAYLLDVSGHGVGVSLHSVSILNTIKFMTFKNVDYRQPEQVLSKLNRVYQMKNHNNLFFTIWYGVYNVRTKVSKYASAGHPPAILIHPDGTTQYLGTKNIFIGGKLNFNFTADTVQIPSGSKLYIYSDGVYEINDEYGNIWSIDKLSDYLVSTVSQESKQLDELYNYVKSKQIDGKLNDDFSIIKMEVF